MPTITITLANAQQHAHELIVDVLNKEFGTNYKGYQKSTWNVSENAVVWFPTLSDGTTDFEGWQNVLSPDGETIYKVWGWTDLEKGGWKTPARPWHRFFKVEVSLPTGASDEETAVAGLVLESNGVQLWENGPYWAEYNVGASKPEEFGYCFWWGDTIGYKRNASNDGWVSVVDDTQWRVRTARDGQGYVCVKEHLPSCCRPRRRLLPL